MTDNSPCLDKIIPKDGYTPENVQVISVRANRIKTDASVDEIGKVYHYLVKIENERNRLQPMMPIAGTPDEAMRVVIEAGAPL